MRLPPILFLVLLASQAVAEAPDVVTDIPPVQSLAAQVMGDMDTPGILLEKSADPHHFQLRPSQARALSQAELVFWVGPELTPWLARALGGLGGGAKVVILLDAPGTTIRDFASAHETEHEAEHDHGTRDPHAWLDPANARAWIGTIQAELSKANPDHANAYAANATAAIARIDEAEAQARAILVTVGDTPIMVFHDAYGYFADAFGVNIVGSISLGDASAPGAGRLAAIRQDLEHEGAVCVFPEAQHDPAYVRAMVEGTGTRIGRALDPSGTTLPYGPALYGDLLVNMAQTIADCVAAKE